MSFLFASLFYSLLFSGCLPPVNDPVTLSSKSSSSFNSTTSTPTVSAGTDGSLLTSSTIVGGVKGQCLAYDTADPRRSICQTCYDSTLTQRCPGKQFGFQCTDAVIRNLFPQMVNTCIQNTLVAGLVCNKTCVSGLILDAASCTCISPPQPNLANSIRELTDTGQYDFGAPLVTLLWAQQKNEVDAKRPDTADSNDNNQCNVNVNFGLTIQNRGGTLLTRNAYGVSHNPPTNPGMSAPISGLGLQWVSDLRAPTPTFGARAPQNGVIHFQLNTGGQLQLPGISTSNPTYSSQQSPVMTLSGQAAMSSSSTAGQPTYLASTSGTLFANASWSTDLGSITTDQYGNLYVVDRGASVVRVLCNFAEAGIPWCDDTSKKGRVYDVLGTANSAGDPLTGISTDTFNLSTFLSKPTGVAVDLYGNLAVTVQNNGSNGQLLLACYSLTGVCGGGLIRSTTGTVAVAQKGFLVEGSLSYPSGVDLMPVSTNLDGLSAYNVYVANHSDRPVDAYCRAPDNHTCGAVAATSSFTRLTGVAGQNSHFASDIKFSPRGVAYVAFPDSHQIVAQCGSTIAGAGLTFSQTGAATDRTACDPGNAVTFGTGTAARFDDGTSASLATLSAPWSLTVAKRHVGIRTPDATFGDENIAFTENLTSTVTPATGVTVRMICFEKNGFCGPLLTGTLTPSFSAPKAFRLSGLSGVSLGGNLNEGYPSRYVPYSGLSGITYDPFKNLIVASQKDDRSLRAILYQSASPVLGIATEYTDEYQQKSRYCLKFQALTRCYGNRCSCETTSPIIETGTDAFSEAYLPWKGIRPTESCP